MLIEGLSNITFVNGILRVECTSIDPSGKETTSGTLEIPGANVNGVLNGLINSAKAIEEKLNSMQEDSANSGAQKIKEKKDTKKKKK
tara:strand:- start:315 stop:575 length:261 start_codon:yes stop_codon:yes gene_type:complete